MKISNVIWMLVGVSCAAGMVGCGKSEPAPSAPVEPKAVQPDTTVPALQPAEPIAPVPSLNVAPTATAAPTPTVATLQIPNFQTASVDDISTVASQVLGGLSKVTASSPSLADKVASVQAALTAGKAMDALSSLTGLSAAVKGIPGAAGLADSATQLVSAWALKQGFDTAKISGVLGALQKKDYASLASQATSVLSKGGLSGDQQGLLKGVLAAYGIDTTKAAGAVNAVKGLLGN
jgi:hypothetical protein